MPAVIPQVTDWSPILSNVQHGSAIEAVIVIFAATAAVIVVFNGAEWLVNAIQTWWYKRGIDPSDYD